MRQAKGCRKVASEGHINNETSDRPSEEQSLLSVIVILSWHIWSTPPRKIENLRNHMRRWLPFLEPLDSTLEQHVDSRQFFCPEVGKMF